MNTTSAPASTITCLTCGGVTETDSPWTNTHVVYCADCAEGLHDESDAPEKFERMVELEQIVTHARVTASMGLRPWDRERGAKQMSKALAELSGLIDNLTPAEGRAYGAYRTRRAAQANR